jgi:hypothetical protein
MPLDNGASPPVRPVAENGSSFVRPKLETSPDFELTLDQVLAGLDQMMGSTWRAEALCRARREILAAVDTLVKAERRKTVAALTPAQLRKEVRELLDSHEALLDYVDTIERWPRIGEELKKLRVRGELPWPL